MTFEEWWEQDLPKWCIYDDEIALAKFAAEAGWNAAIDEAVRVAEDLSETFYSEDDNKWPEMREDRPQGAASAAEKIKELKQ